VTTPQAHHVLVTAVEAVRDLMEKRLDAGDGRALDATLVVRAIHPPRPSDLCWLIRPA
jgi:hypothetical protein